MKNFSVKYITAAFLLLCYAFSPSLPLALEAPVAVTIYEGKNFTGEAVKIGQDTPSLKKMNKKMSSFKVSPGYKVRFFSEQDFQGKYYTRSSGAEDQSNLGTIDNSIQSIKILVNGQPEQEQAPVAVTLYDKAGHSGQSMQIRYNTPYLGTMDKKMSSFKISAGYTVRFFTEHNYEGGFYTKDSHALEQAHTVKYDNIVRSVKILKVPVQETDSLADRLTSPWSDVAVTLYNQKDHQGDYLEVTKDIPNLSKTPIELASFKVSTGYKVAFYEANDYQGRAYSEDVFSAHDSRPPYAKGYIGSVKILEKPKGEYNSDAHPVIAILYDKPHFKGNILKVRGDIPDLRAWSGRVASYQIQPRYKVRFYEQKEFYGTKFYDRTADDAPNSATPSFTGRINAIQLLNNELIPSKATFFEEQNYQGNLQEIRYSLANIENVKMSSYSINCDHQYRVKFYDRPNFEGNHWVFFPCYKKGQAKGFDDAIRSVEILPPSEEEFPDALIFARLWSHPEYTGTSFRIYHSDLGSLLPDGLLPWNYQNRMQSYELLPCYQVEFRSSEINSANQTWVRDWNAFDRRDASAMKAQVKAVRLLGTPVYPGRCLE